jgi:hypothetical protein
MKHFVAIVVLAIAASTSAQTCYDHVGKACLELGKKYFYSIFYKMK